MPWAAEACLGRPMHRCPGRPRHRCLGQPVTLPFLGPPCLPPSLGGSPPFLGATLLLQSGGDHVSFRGCPGKKCSGRKKKKRKTEYNFIVIRSRDGYLLELRDPNGIWPGLWSFPALEINEKIGTWVALNVGTNEPYEINYMDQFTHSLSHIDITINPILIDISEHKEHKIKKDMMFAKQKKIRSLGISKAVKKIIDRL